MKNGLTKEDLQNYPYLEKFQEYTLFLSNDEVDDLKNSRTIKVLNNSVSIKFLKKILQDERFFYYAHKYFSNETDKFKVASVIGDGDIKEISYNKINIINGIINLIDSGDWFLTFAEEDKFKKLKKLLSLDYYIKNNENNIYNIKVDNVNYSIPIKDIMQFITLPLHQFIEYCINKDIDSIYGLPKKHFVYAVIRYFEEKELFINLIIPDEILNKLKKIKSNELIDIQAINQILESDLDICEQIDINDELKQLIIGEMPNDLSKLEKAIYIYIKMCKILTYDEEFLAINQKGNAATKHQNINYIKLITPANKNVVCYEFNLIYSKLLTELKINFITEYQNMMGYAYGQTHANLEFRCDDFLVVADSVTSILEGDLMQAKVNQPLRGLRCNNQNVNTRLDFQSLVTKIYEIVANQEKNNNENINVEHILTLDELLDQYEKMTSNKKEVTLEEKLSILISKINDSNLIGVDSLSYILQLRKILFNQKERDNNIKVVISRNNEPKNNKMTADAIAIIAFNDKNSINNIDENSYFYFKPHNEPQKLSIAEIQQLFDSGVIEYIDSNGPEIPGIMKGVKR